MGLTRHGHSPFPLRAVIDRRHERDLNGLLATLDDGSTEARRRAARELAAHPEAAEALAMQLARESEQGVRAALFSSLACIGGADTVQGLLPLLRSDDAALRNGALEVLAGLPMDVASELDALLDDADGDVRIFAVNLLGDLRHPDVPRWLLRVLSEEASPNVVGAALEVAAEAGDPSLLPALQQVRERFADEPYLRFAADLACQRIASA